MGYFSKINIEIGTIVFTAILIVIVTFSFEREDKSKSKENHELHCTPNSSYYLENITQSSFRNGGRITKSGLFYPSSAYWTSPFGTIWGCPCMIKPCVRSCKMEETSKKADSFESALCKDCHEPFFNYSNLKIFKTKPANLNGTPEEIAVKKDHFYVIDGLKCNEEKNIPTDFDDQKKFFLQENGSLLFMNNSKLVLIDYNKFCIHRNNLLKINFKLCATDYTFKSEMLPESGLTQSSQNEGNTSTPWWIYTLRVVGMVISIPCLAITLFVYILLSQLRNLHGKSLICYTTSLTITYCSLALVYTGNPDGPGILCGIIAFTIQFSVLASFFWLNVMCFDIWWAFSGVRPLHGSKKATERVKFLLYSCYAWGGSLGILAVSIFMEYSPCIPVTAIRPNMGVNSCFFNDESAQVLYLYLPVGVIVYLNICMFVTTAARLHGHSQSARLLHTRDSRRHNTKARSSDDVERFDLYLKLLGMMGINWVMELVSFWVGGHSGLWLVTDLANTLLGVVVLWQSVIKSRPLRLLRQRLLPPPPVNNRTTTTNTDKSSSKLPSSLSKADSTQV